MPRDRILCITCAHSTGIVENTIRDSKGNVVMSEVQSAECPMLYENTHFPRTVCPYYQTQEEAESESLEVRGYC